MSHPTYIRSSSESSFQDVTSSVKDDSELRHTGLRRKKLCAVLTILTVLTMVALLLLVMNLMIVSALQMDQHGMRFLKFHSVWNPKTNEKEKVVQFSGNDIDLGSVVTKSGSVVGNRDMDMNIQGSRVIIMGHETQGSHLILQENGCKLENSDQFQVISSKTGRPIFSAQHPLVSIDKRIKKLSTNKIITNKIRSPVDESLTINVENISFRGNEGVRMEANNVKFISKQSIYFNTSTDGSIHLQGPVVIGSLHKGIPLSQSPALSASIDAHRVCVCAGPKQKLFVVPGNKPCFAVFDTCA